MSATATAVRPLEEWRHAYLDAAVRGDRQRALAIVEEARRAGLGLSDLYLELFAPVQETIGRLWEENRLSVAQEHLATAVTQAVMNRLYVEEIAPRAAQGPRLIAACVDGERHELGLRMVCDLLELDGWNALWVGASTPLPDLIDLVRREQPRAVALSVSLPAHLPRLQEAALHLRERVTPAPLLVAGGRAFTFVTPDPPRWGVDVIATDPREAVARLRPYRRAE